MLREPRDSSERQAALQDLAGLLDCGKAITTTGDRKSRIRGTRFDMDGQMSSIAQSPTDDDIDILADYPSAMR